MVKKSQIRSFKIIYIEIILRIHKKESFIIFLNSLISSQIFSISSKKYKFKNFFLITVKIN